MVTAKLALAIYAISPTRGAGLNVHAPGGVLPTALLAGEEPISVHLNTAIDSIFGVPGLAETAVGLEMPSMRPAYAEVLPPLDRKGAITIPVLVLLPKTKTAVVISSPRPQSADISWAALPLARGVTSLMAVDQVTDRESRRVVWATSQRLSDLLRHTRAGMNLAGPVFTINELRTVYEDTWGHRLDPSNFYKRITKDPGLLLPVPHDPSERPSGIRDDQTRVAIDSKPPTVGAIAYTYGPRELPAWTSMTVWRGDQGRPSGLYVRGKNPYIDPSFARPEPQPTGD